MSLRFKVGEPAIFAVAVMPDQIAAVGKHCIVERVGPFAVGDIIHFKGSTYIFGRACDYICMFDAENGVIAHDWQLRKIDPPAEPASLTRSSDIEEEATA